MTKVMAAQIQPGDLIVSLVGSLGNPVVRFRFAPYLVSEKAYIHREFLFEASPEEWQALLEPWSHPDIGGMAIGQIRSDKDEDYQGGAIVLTKPLPLMVELPSTRCVLVSLIREKAGEVEIAPQLAISADVVLPPLVGVLSQGVS